MGKKKKLTSKKLIFDSSLRDVETLFIAVDKIDSVEVLISLFSENKTLPGVIVVVEKNFYSMIARNSFYQIMSKKYSIELFSKRSIAEYLEENPSNNILVLESEITVLDDTTLALDRISGSVFDPIVVRFENRFGIIDIYQLLMKQVNVHLRTLDSLHKANELKDELMNITSHDLKNPIHAIFGLTEILKDNSDNPEIKEISASIYLSAKRMYEIITQIMNSSRIEEGKMHLEISNFSISELARNVYDSFTILASSKKQKLILKNELKENLIITSDKLKMTGILENLISNALKYSPIESTVIINLSQKNNKIRFEIIDSGPGLTEDDKKKIIQKIFKNFSYSNQW
ncbi:MAG: hypothetical protein C0425_04295 [Chlorobiaceae bacterium]|nr:hypothetical protein [Chlorobiaceae bacterium]MBA4309537.1 hypothetical protein [Chlorobiaceae bacterium]